MVMALQLQHTSSCCANPVCSRPFDRGD